MRFGGEQGANGDDADKTGLVVGNIQVKYFAGCRVFMKRRDCVLNGFVLSEGNKIPANMFRYRFLQILFF